jgi:hypothetical protein
MDAIDAEVKRLANETAEVWRCLRIPPRICLVALGTPVPGPPYKVYSWEDVEEVLERHIRERNSLAATTTITDLCREIFP